MVLSSNAHYEQSFVCGNCGLVLSFCRWKLFYGEDAARVEIGRLFEICSDLSDQSIWIIRCFHHEHSSTGCAEKYELFLVCILRLEKVHGVQVISNLMFCHFLELLVLVVDAKLTVYCQEEEVLE